VKIIYLIDKNVKVGVSYESEFDSLLCFNVQADKERKNGGAEIAHSIECPFKRIHLIGRFSLLGDNAMRCII